MEVVNYSAWIMTPLGIFHPNGVAEVSFRHVHAMKFSGTFFLFETGEKCLPQSIN